MARIAISYRREDSGIITGRIFDRRVTRYGREAIFRDIDDVPPGVDFREHISEVLDASDIVLAIIGPRWLGPRGAQSRLANEADPVRVEIEAALRKGVPLIPVLVMRGNMPQASQLPEAIRDFAFRNAVQVDTGQDFDVHAARLVRALDRLLEQKSARETAAAQAEATPSAAPTEESADAASLQGILRATPPPPEETAGTASVAAHVAATAPFVATKTGRYLVGIAVLGTVIGILLGIGVQRYLSAGPPAVPLPADIAAAVQAQQTADAKVKALHKELAAVRSQVEQDRKRLAADAAAAQEARKQAETEQNRLAGDLAGARDKAAAAQSQAEQDRKRLAADAAAAQEARKQAETEQKRLAADFATARDQAAAAQKQANERATQLQEAEARAAQAEKQLAAREDADPGVAAQLEALNAQAKSLNDQLAQEKAAHHEALAQVDKLTAEINAPPPVTPPATAAAASDAEQSWTIDEKRQIQNDLLALGHLRGEADGNFGPATGSAIKEFQSFEGETESGALSEAERRTLHEMATRLETFLQRPVASPLAVEGATVRGAAQRYARAWDFETGKGVRANPAEAVYWYGLAAADGEAKALTNLGTLLVRGQGVPAVDTAGAALLWQAAAAHGEATAMFNLGAMWEHGIGVTADLDKAKAWYQRAAARNNPEARAAMQRLGS